VRVRAALRELVRDAWVVPIAAAAALAYATVVFVQNLVHVVTDLAVQSTYAAQVNDDSILGLDNLFREPMMLRVGSRVLFMQPLLESALVLLFVVVASALALRWTSRDAPVELDV
jgi:hypothetical protein